MMIGRSRTRSGGLGFLMERHALEENEFHRAQLLVEGELTGHPSHRLQRMHGIQRGVMGAAIAGSALAPDNGMPDAEFACNKGNGNQCDRYGLRTGIGTETIRLSGSGSRRAAHTGRRSCRQPRR